MAPRLVSRLVRLFALVAGHIRRRRLVWFVAACAVALAFESWLLFAPQVLTVRGRRPLGVSALGEGRQISQTFVAHADGLEALQVGFSSGSEAVVVEVEAALAELTTEGAVPLYRWRAGEAFVGRKSHTFVFPPVRKSRGRMYRLDLRLVRPATAPIAIDACADDVLRPGRLMIDGREQWGDLAFRARAASRYRNFLTGARGLPGAARSGELPLLLLAMYNAAMIAFVYYMIVAGESSWREADRRQSEQVHT